MVRSTVMTASLTRRPAPFTYREYCLLPEDGKRHELIEGDFFVTPAPSPRHQTVSRRLQYLLMQALEEPGHAQVFDAPVDLLLHDESVVQPDLVVVSTARTSLITARGIEGVPDLVVEILSPSTGDRDLQLKRRVYERFGIPEYWVVDPVSCFVTVWTLENGRYEQRAYLDRASTLTWPDYPELSVDLSRVFRP